MPAWKKSENRRLVEHPIEHPGKERNFKDMEARTGNGPKMDWSHFVDDLRTVVHDGEELLKAGFGRARTGATAKFEAAGRAVHAQPYQSLALGFGLGLITGLLLYRSLTPGSARED